MPAKKYKALSAIARPETVESLVEIFKAMPSLHWRTRVKPAEAAALFRAVRRPHIASLIDAVSARIPPMDYGPGNPNTGHSHHEFDIGREYSPVVYLRVVKGYLPADFDLSELALGLKQIAARFKQDDSDEADVTSDPDDGTFEFRFWFDKQWPF